MSYRTEFPTFPDSAIPAELLAGDWEDTSYHNDTAPSFQRGRFSVMIDWPEPMDREYPESPRYSVADTTEGAFGTVYGDAFVSDDWTDILRYIATGGR